MKIYSADLETTVYEGQDHTEAWASALVALDSDTPLVFHSLDDTLDYLDYQDEDAVLYYHNLKFDGNFWLSFLITQKNFKQGLEYISPTEITFKDKKDLKEKEQVLSIKWFYIPFGLLGCIICLLFLVSNLFGV